MSVGANISFKGQMRLRNLFWQYLNQPRAGKGTRLVHPKMCVKAGVPANNTAADNPNALYDICIDKTNGDIYICTAFTANASATTWTKITD